MPSLKLGPSPRRPWCVVAACLLAVAGCNCGDVPLSAEGDAGDAWIDASSPSTDSGEGDVGSGLPDGGTVDSGSADASTEVGDGGSMALDAGCPPVSCSEKCGAVRDFCSGHVIQCGGCLSGLVCDLDTHKCVTPKTTCAAMAAECGRVRDSCGNVLDCGTCPSGKECDRNTHHCVPCSQPTCTDLGYQCGLVWLGCGSETNTTDCGGCPPGQVCNPSFHVCEPQQCPSDDKCAGVACGSVDNGCGGLKDCGNNCPTGTKCGARGIANRCDPPELPDECAAANRVCGTLTSACGGTPKSCGTCTGADHCRANGTCGPVCTPKACGSGELQGKCGVQLDDGCGGILVACACPNGATCSLSLPGAVGTCIDCSTYGANGRAGDPCSIGPAPDFPKGDGTNLACACSNSGHCNKPGTTEYAAANTKGQCCVKTATCAANECNTSKTDPCTGETVACGDCTAAGYHCNTQTHTCEQDCCIGHACQTVSCNGQSRYCPCLCSSYGANGNLGNACSNGPAFSDGATPPTLIPCKCTSLKCSNGGKEVAGADKGTCCQNSATCGNSCNRPLYDSCTGAVLSQCPCPTGYHCDAASNGTCVLDSATCDSYGANGDETHSCTTAPYANPKWTAYTGDSTGLVCPCDSPMVCSFAIGTGGASGTEAGKGQVGTCCRIPTYAAGDAGKECTSVANPCKAGSIRRPCRSGFFCAQGTCSACPAGNVADTCSNGNDPTDFPRYPGDTTGTTCKCSGTNKCYLSGAEVSGSTAGTCCARAVLPSGAVGDPCSNSPDTWDGCLGKNVARPCATGNYCNAGHCAPYDKPTCASFSPPGNGKPSAPCSTTNDPVHFPRYPGDPTGLTCPCSTQAPYSSQNVCVSNVCQCTKKTAATCTDNGKPDGCGGTMSFPCTLPNTCGGGGTPGVCGCTKKKCVDLGCGSWPDGCGGTITCTC